MAGMMTECLHCRATLSLEKTGPTDLEQRCERCGTVQMQQFYPAAMQPRTPTAVPEAVEEGASCFFHETTPATTLCDDCGRYCCTLCTFPVPEPANKPRNFPERLCPVCFERLIAQEQQRPGWDLFQTAYPRYDIAALFLVLAPVILFPLFIFTIVTAPIALFIILRHWQQSRNPVHPTRDIMLTLTLLGALLELLFWALIVFSILVEVFA